MRLQVVRAIYKDGTLLFAQPELTPRDGTEVIVTYLEDDGVEGRSILDLIHALRGRGKGEPLVERLLQSRREEQERDDTSRGHLCA